MRKLLMVDESGVQRRYPAVAKIVGRAESQNVEVPYATISMFFGTGVYVAEYGPWGIVITNWHVVVMADKSIDVCFPSGKYSGRVILRDEKWDLAAILIPKPEGIKPIPISLTVPYFNDRLWVGGYGPTSGLDNFELREGVLLKYVSLELPKELKTSHDGVLDTSGALYETEMINVGVRSGDSGGPVFNEYGELTGCLWGSDHKSSMGTNGPRIILFVMQAIQEASRLRARKILAAETTKENPDHVLSIGEAPNECEKANEKLSNYSEEDAFEIVKKLTHAAATGERPNDGAGLDFSGIDLQLYPVSSEPLYVSGNGIDTPESLRRLGAMKAKHVQVVAEEYWKRNPGGLPPSPPIYSQGYLGLQFICDRDVPEVIASDSFKALDAQSRQLAEVTRQPTVPMMSPIDELDAELGKAEFAQVESGKAEMVPVAASSSYADPGVSSAVAATSDASALAAPQPSSSADWQITQFQAYALFCFILVMLCLSAILHRNGDARRRHEGRRS